MENKVSVVLCTYNGSAYLKKQLDSILQQTYPIDEIIIVDDCSTDSTRTILYEYKERFKEIKLFLNNKNLGPSLSFKYAISLASTEYIALCDQDDMWDINKIKAQMDSIISFGYHLDYKPLVVFHDLCLIDEHDKVTKDSFWNLHNFNPKNFSFKKLLISNIVTGCTCVINKSMKEEIIKCDMKDIIMHDYLIALIGYGFGNSIYINERLIYYRSHSSSVTEKEKMTFVSRFQIFISKIGSGDYLMPNILQIQKFNDLYRHKLDTQNKNLVDYFVALKSKGIISIMVYKWLMN